MNAINLETSKNLEGPPFDMRHTSLRMRHIAEDSMRLLGLLGTGETAAAEDIQFGCRMATRILNEEGRYHGTTPTERQLVFALAFEMAPAYLVKPSPIVEMYGRRQIVRFGSEPWGIFP